MLKQHKRKALPWVSGQVLVVGLCLGLGTVAWASQGGAPAANTVEPKVIDTTAPKYPVAAFKQGLSGKVELRVDVGIDGTVTDVRVLSATAPGVFDEAALGAARQWRFQPALEDGKPVTAALQIPVTFEANGKAPAR